MSKVKISFELDLSCNSSLNIATIADLRGSLQNLSSLLYELHTHHLVKLSEAHCYKGDPERPDSLEAIKAYLIKTYTEDAAVTEQLFNNYTVSGVTDDGHEFLSTHQNHNYHETMTIDGVLREDF